VGTAKRVTWANQDDTKSHSDSTHRVNSQPRKKGLNAQEKQGQLQWRPKNTIANATTAIPDQLQEKKSTEQQHLPLGNAAQSKSDDSGGTRTKEEEKQQRKNGTGESRTRGTINSQ